MPSPRFMIVTLILMAIVDYILVETWIDVGDPVWGLINGGLVAILGLVIVSWWASRSGNRRG